MNEEENLNNTETKKSVLHFSDGILEVSEEVTETSAENANPRNDPDTSNWGPWAIQKSKEAGDKALKVCDYLGESLASFLGITTPKYQYEINEYYRLQKEKEERMAKDLEMGSWTEAKTTGVISEQLQSSRPEPALRY